VSRHDRRELGFLGALLLGWALVAAPALHLSFSHGGSPEPLAVARALPLKAPAHSHGPSAPGAHGEGSLEHGKAFFSAPPAPPALVLVLVSLAAVVVVTPSVVELAPRFAAAQPQGP
jgi:hypothetical protein